MKNKLKNRFGFGIMRLPVVDEKFDKESLCEMVDLFIKKGFNYFDTAHGYMDGLSEIAVRECIVKRYPRDEIVIADKLSEWFFKSEEEIEPLFNKQLENCGVDYFDFYLFHCITDKSYAKHKELNSFSIIENMKKQGKIKHLGMSFHDSAEVLDKILTNEPQIEFVQLQFNYLDYEDPTVQSKACYDVAVKHGKKVFVMEPIRGGALVNIPDEAAEIFKSLGGTPASYALSFVANHKDVVMILSGMNTLSMVEENTETFKNMKPLTDKEYEGIFKARDIILKSRTVKCTGCNYCLDVCPGKIHISELIKIYNEYMLSHISRGEFNKLALDKIKGVTDCTKCGACEGVCPQKINIREITNKIKSQ